MKRLTHILLTFTILGSLVAASPIDDVSRQSSVFSLNGMFNVSWTMSAGSAGSTSHSLMQVTVIRFYERYVVLQTKSGGGRMINAEHLTSLTWEPQEKAVARRAGQPASVNSPLAKAGATNPYAGLVGGTLVNGKKSGVAFHYLHGKVFPPEMIRDRFHDPGTPLPAVSITLVGYVNVPSNMTVKIWHAGGGVNGDWNALYVDNRLLGKVGDDLKKNMIYVTQLKKGVYQVRWVLNGGTFQHNLLKFEDPESGKLLTLFHTGLQRTGTGASTADELVEAASDKTGWPLATSPKGWTLETIPQPDGDK
jgi:hypothetical protein